MAMASAGTAICLPGNHDVKLVRRLKGRDVRIAHGLSETLAQLEAESDEFRDQARDFLDRLVSHVVLDDGRLVVAHAGMKQAYQGRSSGRVRDFALFGETTGETDELGLPVRLEWARDYRGDAAVVYGHTPVAAPEWVNRTINIDTGCVFGGRLTALRWPERELVSVSASRTYYEPVRPLLPEGAPPAAAGVRPAFLLDVEDVAGRRVIATRLARTVTVREENAAAALEVMSRFACDPRWLVYLPPTMAPTATSRRPDLLEHPEDAFAEYRAEGVARVICEEKHMGSRAVVIVCRDADVATSRFGVEGRRDRCDLHPGPVARSSTTAPRPRTRSAGSAARSMRPASGRRSTPTGWCSTASCCHGSAKATELIRRQYASVGAAAHAGLNAGVTTLEAAAERGLDVANLIETQRRRSAHVDRYVDAYRRYVWPVDGVADLRLAPFHVLAAESGVFVDRDHPWHLDLCDRLVAADGDWLIPTARFAVDLADRDSRSAAIAWWERLTDQGGEGMVVKPSGFVADGRTGLAQPGIKCRGREYLRLVYGPEYADPEQIGRLRTRSLGRKRSLAIREFGLGVEGLERFVAREPLHRVHECVFGVLAMESEPVDPRL